MADTFADMASDASQDDYATAEWLTTPEGWQAQADMWARHDAVDELIQRSIDCLDTDLMPYVPSAYAKANTQLMLF